MKDPSFSCLQQQLPRPQDGDLCKIDCVYARPKVVSSVSELPQIGRGSRKSHQSSLMIHPWILAHSEQRRLSVLNTELGIFKIKQMLFDHRKVTCITYVDGCMWMGAEVNTCIEIIAQPLVGMPKCSWKLSVPAPVLALTTTIDYEATAAHVRKFCFGTTVFVLLKVYMFRVKLLLAESLLLWQMEDFAHSFAQCPGRSYVSRPGLIQRI